MCIQMTSEKCIKRWNCHILQELFMNERSKIKNKKAIYYIFWWGRRDRDRMVVGFITTYAICLSPLTLLV